MPLNRDQLRNTPRKTQDVDVPGIGAIRVREPDAGIVADVFDGGPIDRAKSLRLLMHCLVDDDGNRLFDGPRAVDEIGRELPGHAFGPLVEAAVSLAGFGDDGEESDGEANPSEAAH